MLSKFIINYQVEVFDGINHSLLHSYGDNIRVTYGIGLSHWQSDEQFEPGVRDSGGRKNELGFKPTTGPPGSTISPESCLHARVRPTPLEVDREAGKRSSPHKTPLEKDDQS